MIEVFKTNVTETAQARYLVDIIHNSFINYMANFDLEDCDRVLRIKCLNGKFDPAMIIKFLEVLGVQAEVLSDVVEIQNKMQLRQEVCTLSHYN